MKRSWEPEICVDISLAKKLIQEQFPKINVTTIEILGVGWDNTAFVVENKYVFRFPRRKIAVSLIEIEYCFLPKIVSSLPLKIPIPKYLGQPSEHFPWCFLGYEKISGVTACKSKLSEEERILMIDPIARFLLALHQIPLDQGKSCHLSGDTIGRLDVKRLINEIEKNLGELKSLKLVEKLDNVDKILSCKVEAVSNTIVHGDFYVRHLLVDSKRKLTGVIDWGDVHIGDVAVDLAFVHSFFPSKVHEAFQNVYGAISDETWALSKLRALHHNAALAVYGYHTKDQNILFEALRSLTLILT